MYVDMPCYMMLWALRRRIFEKTQTYSNQQKLHGFKLTDDFWKHFEHFETKNIMGGYYDTTGLLFNAVKSKHSSKRHHLGVSNLFLVHLFWITYSIWISVQSFEQKPARFISSQEPSSCRKNNYFNQVHVARISCWWIGFRVTQPIPFQPNNHPKWQAKSGQNDIDKQFSIFSYSTSFFNPTKKPKSTHSANASWDKSLNFIQHPFDKSCRVHTPAVTWTSTELPFWQ